MNAKIGFAPLLTLVFILLKIFGAINWSWVWVFSPLWIGAIIVCILLSIIGILQIKW